MSSWIVPDFDEFKHPSNVIKKTAQHRPGSGSKSSGKAAARERRSPDPHGNAKKIKSEHLPPLPLPWTQKYFPKSSAELVVHKKKVGDVRSLLQNVFDGRLGPFIVLTGPPGCGKYATIRCLADEMGLQLSEWINSDCPFNPTDENSSYESQEKRFGGFLLRASHFRDLTLDSSQNQVPQSQGARQMLLVKELPYFAFSDPLKLFGVLKEHSRCIRTPVVFIITESFAGDTNMRKLFPSFVLNELRATIVKFNPITDLVIKKHLQKILADEYGSKRTGRGKASSAVMTEAQVAQLVESARGDLRSAILALQFACDTGSSSSLHAARIAPVIFERDRSIDLYRSVGRVFHVKRTEEPVDTTHLPPRLLSQARRPLTYVPEEIFDRSTCNFDIMISFLHENYGTFINDLERCDQAAEYLSLADVLTSNWSTQQSTLPYGASVAIRGLMFLNDGVNQPKASFRAFVKPASIDIRHKVESRLEDGKRIVRDLSRRIRCTTSSLFTDYIPLLARIFPLGNPTEANLYLKEMISYSGYYKNRGVLQEGETFDVSETDPVNLITDQLSQSSVQEDDRNQLKMNCADSDSDDLFDTNLQIEEFDDDW